MNNLKVVEKLYYAFEHVCDDYKDFPETKEANENFMNYIKQHNIVGNAGTDQRLFDLDDLVTAIASVNEKQGFYYGFNYAVSLLMGKAGDQNA